MTPTEHRAEAERLLALSKTARYAADRDRARLDANTHALLALLGKSSGGYGDFA